MYSVRSGLILGFHGCDESVVLEVIRGKEVLKPSENDYDWLGNGIYFWEGNCQRALEYAKLLKKHPSRVKGKVPIKNPAVLGAVISLGYCLDLLEHESINRVKQAYITLDELAKVSESPLPENVLGPDRVLRRLDCAVIESLHEPLDTADGVYYDSVRGMFPEGERLYADAGFHEHSHIQLCIRNPNCIKGYFLPRNLNGEHKKV